VLAHRLDERDGAVLLRLSQPSEVAAVLNACEAAGCVLDDVEVGRADLEDVFLQITSDAGKSQRVAA
jgi:ABC-2 type transport system ATP-binding protein